MDRPGNDPAGDRIPGRRKPIGIGLPLIDEGIEFRKQKVGRRQTRRVGHPQGRRPHIPAALRIRAVVLPEPEHVFCFQEQFFSQSPHRFGFRARVGCRVNKQLKANRRATGIAGEKSHDRRQIATRAVSAHGNPCRINLKFFCLRLGPHQGSERIVHGRRKGMFRCQSVVDRKHSTTGPRSEAGSHTVGRIQTAEHPSATVVVDQ